MLQIFTAITLLSLTLGAYFVGRNRAVKLIKLHSLPSYHGYFTALWTGLPGAILFLIWIVAEPLPTFPNFCYSTSCILFTILCLLTSSVGLMWSINLISPQFQARNQVELALRNFMIVCSTIAIVTTIGIVLSVLFESILFFHKIPLNEFLFGLEWSPGTAIRADQVGASGKFGIIPLFVGTILISCIALLVAVPIGLLTAIHLSEYAGPKTRAIAKPALEILAGIPTVVYGFFAALTVAPAMRDFGNILGLDVASESAIAAGLVMGIMIIPFVSSLSDDVINAVPQSLRDGSYALGATHSETVTRVILPAALSGIVGSILLAASRAIGETMIVVMAAGLSANLTFNPLAAVTTVTVQIVTLLTGDQEFDSAKTLAAFALGLVLFIVTLILNIIALHVVRVYREQYE
jgi:phosphate transport system permease protein